MSKAARQETVVGWTSVGVMMVGFGGCWREVGGEGFSGDAWVERDSSREVRKARSSASAASSRVRARVGSARGASWVENGEVVSLGALSWDENWAGSDGSECLDSRIGVVESEESFGEVHSHPIAVAYGVNRNRGRSTSR